MVGKKENLGLNPTAGAGTFDTSEKDFFVDLRENAIHRVMLSTDKFTLQAEGDYSQVMNKLKSHKFEHGFTKSATVTCQWGEIPKDISLFNQQIKNLGTVLINVSFKEPVDSLRALVGLMQLQLDCMITYEDSDDDSPEKRLNPTYNIILKTDGYGGSYSGKFSKIMEEVRNQPFKSGLTEGMVILTQWVEDIGKEGGLFDQEAKIAGSINIATSFLESPVLEMQALSKLLENQLGCLGTDKSVVVTVDKYDGSASDDSEDSSY